MKKTYLKVILAGEARVGKTAIRLKYFGKGFNNSYIMTIGADFSLKRYNNYLIQIWDLAGQLPFRSVRKEYYLGTQGAILVFDHTRPETFSGLGNWLDEIEVNNGVMVPLILVGNKIDLLSEAYPGIPDEEVLAFTDELTEKFGFQIPYIRTSAATGHNIDFVFRKMIEELTEEPADPII